MNSEQTDNIQRVHDEFDKDLIEELLTERDALRAALLTIRDCITPATAYPETVAWVRATVDGVVKPEP